MMMPQQRTGSEYAEEVYFYLFHVSQKSHRILMVKLIMNLCFLVFLAVKLNGDQGITWFGSFVCLFNVNVLMLLVEVDEAVFLWSTADSPLRMLKPLATITDIIGSAYAKGLILFLLVNKLLPANLTVLLLPSWICVMLSAGMRCLIARKRIPAELANRHRTASYISAVIYFIFRGVQPLLVVLKVDGLLPASWFHVFAPAFAIAFSGLGGSFLLFSAVPCVHYNANRQLRDVARYLTRLIAFCLLLAAACSLVFLVTLCQSFEEHRKVNAFRLLAPLLVLYGSYLLAAMLFFHFYREYQSQLSARVLQRLDRPAGSNYLRNGYQAVPSTVSPLPMSKWANLKPQRETHWLIQVSPSLYTVSSEHTMPTKDSCAAYAAGSPSGSRSKLAAPTVAMGDIEMAVIPVIPEGDNSELPLTMAMEGGMSNRFPSTDNLAASPYEHASDRCIVCFLRPVSVILRGCGHAVTCLTCALAIAEQHNLRSAHCPLCRHTYTSLIDLPLGHRYEYPLPADPVPNESGDIEMATMSSAGTVAAAKTVTIVHSSWQYLLQPPTPPQGPLVVNIDPSEMNNAQAIGNTVNTLAAVNTISSHYSLIDILL